MAHVFTASYLDDSAALFRHYKKLAEGAMAQVSDEQLLAVLDPEMNSIALIVKHMAGNMRSRWTGFLTSDGEKPDRNRDGEFVEPPATREALMTEWEEGWARLFNAIEPLSDADLSEEVRLAERRIRCCKPSIGRLRIFPITADKLCCWPSTFSTRTGNR